MGMVGGPAGMAVGGYLGNRLGGAVGNMGRGMRNVVSPAANTAKVGADLRNLAQLVRVKGAAADAKRLTKAAQMLTAAVGLKHLTTRLAP